MPPVTLASAPALDTFTTLEEYQARTPAVFFNAKPILHYHSRSVRACAPRSQLSKLPIFTQPANEQTGDAAGDNVVEQIEIFVSSENLTLFNPILSTGLSIPYPAISLHAIQHLDDPSNPGEHTQGLYMNLELGDPNAVTDEDEEMDVIELTIIPPPTSTEARESSAIQTLFDAVSNCSNLNPDPNSQDDEDMADGEADSRIVFEGSVGYHGISGLPGVQSGASDGGLPPPFPGSGGWITAENVTDFFDADGNWIADGEGAESLGEGAGRVRARDEVEDGGVNGHGETDFEDNKRARTD